ncbi:HAD-like domain-containing protein [Nemania abortiva]|nr:HAD-like domain-containing protein [Nemania abortiva]
MHMSGPFFDKFKSQVKPPKYKVVYLFFASKCSVARMHARWNSLFTRRFSHSTIRRIGPRESLVPGRNRKTPSTPSTPPTSPTTPIIKPGGGHATDTISIMSAGSAGYTDPTGYSAYLAYNAAAATFNPLAPSFNPPPQSQPTSYLLPLGEANAIVPDSAPAQSSLAPNPQEQNPHTSAHSRRSPSLKAAQRDKIIQPSLKSGGVPDPTQEYLTLASHPPFLLPQPRNMLVVVDLNGTLLHRPSRHSPTRFVERPYARPFLSYCVNTFTVVIWSSARPRNVSNMCNQLLTPEDRAKVVAVWNRDSFGLSKADYNQRVQCYKRLTALWNDPDVAASHPMAASGEKWSQLNTVLVDDSIEKARSEPFNLLQIPEFFGNAKEAGFVLPQVHDYLNDCSQQANVSSYIKGQPFKIKPEFAL